MQGVLKKSRHSSRKIKLASVLLLLSEGASVEEIVARVDVYLSTLRDSMSREAIEKYTFPEVQPFKSGSRL
ncbi:hypothetical protein [Cesiribacter sp. SM1]|uniref:hypothetical protein n=1 Tax=Cesiribacter sp. SM1 TaxID=2861196 RepID=UPI001CD72CEC|nr:hypothetical protein [Cesiribacter sp. SM1]